MTPQEQIEKYLDNLCKNFKNVEVFREGNTDRVNYVCNAIPRIVTDLDSVKQLIESHHNKKCHVYVYDDGSFTRLAETDSNKIIVRISFDF